MNYFKTQKEKKIEGEQRNINTEDEKNGKKLQKALPTFPCLTPKAAFSQISRGVVSVEWTIVPQKTCSLSFPLTPDIVTRRCPKSPAFCNP